MSILTEWKSLVQLLFLQNLQASFKPLQKALPLIFQLPIIPNSLLFNVRKRLKHFSQFLSYLCIFVCNLIDFECLLVGRQIQSKEKQWEVTVRRMS